MGCCSVELSLTNLIVLGVIVLGVKKLIKLYQKWTVDKMMEKWDDTPKDKLILHSSWRCKSLPTASPYALKLETYLRMAKIPYELDTTDPFSPKGKIPWITLNGSHISDSHLCIQFLNKKFSVHLNKNSTPEQVAIARACRIMLEDHFFWGIVQFRWIENFSLISQIMKVPLAFKLSSPFFIASFKKRMADNGIGKHTRTELYQMTEDDLRTVSSILGNKKFLGGEEPCEDDCAVFGMVAQALMGMPGSSFERIANGELTNLKQYFERMKERYWPDWDNCLDKS